MNQHVLNFHCRKRDLMEPGMSICTVEKLNVILGMEEIIE